MITEKQALKMQLIDRLEIRYLSEYETRIIIDIREYNNLEQNIMEVKQ